VIVADFSAQAVVNSFLHNSFPTDPIVGEEDSKDLQDESGRPMREKVLELANSGLGDLNTSLTEGTVSKAKKRIFMGHGVFRLFGLDHVFVLLECSRMCGRVKTVESTDTVSIGSLFCLFAQEGEGKILQRMNPYG